jgi:hypothetical protein
MLIVPLNDHGQLVAKRFATKWYQWQLGKHRLHRQNQPFHQGNTPVLTDLTEARLDVLAITPVLEILAGSELRSFVRDEMPRLGSSGGDRSPEERADRDHGFPRSAYTAYNRTAPEAGNRNCTRFRLEYGDTHGTS